MTDSNNLENRQKDILQESILKENPFSVPDGYFSALENSVQEKIHKPASHARIFYMKLKPVLLLALTFGIIAGLGYGVSTLTNKITGNEEKDNDIFALIEKGYIKSNFIDDYYEEIDLKKAFRDKIEINDEIAAYFLDNLSEEEIFQLLDIDQNYN